MLFFALVDVCCLRVVVLWLGLAVVAVGWPCLLCLIVL